jgi:hypothetical protein
VFSIFVFFFFSFCLVFTPSLVVDRSKLMSWLTAVLVQPYTLPDGRVIKMSAERFEAPEALFNPSLVDVESAGMAELVFNCINSAAIDTRHEVSGRLFGYVFMCKIDFMTFFMLIIAVLQAHCAERRIHHVPWPAKSHGEGNQGFVLAARAQGRC